MKFKVIKHIFIQTGIYFSLLRTADLLLFNIRTYSISSMFTSGQMGYKGGVGFNIGTVSLTVAQCGCLHRWFDIMDFEWFIKLS